MEGIVKGKKIIEYKNQKVDELSSMKGDPLEKYLERYYENNYYATVGGERFFVPIDAKEGWLNKDNFDYNTMINSINGDKFSEYDMDFLLDEFRKDACYASSGQDEVIVEDLYWNGNQLHVESLQEDFSINMRKTDFFTIMYELRKTIQETYKALKRTDNYEDFMSLSERRRSFGSSCEEIFESSDILTGAMHCITLDTSGEQNEILFLLRSKKVSFTQNYVSSIPNGSIPESSEEEGLRMGMIREMEEELFNEEDGYDRDELVDMLDDNRIELDVTGFGVTTRQLAFSIPMMLKIKDPEVSERISSVSYDEEMRPEGSVFSIPATEENIKHVLRSKNVTNVAKFAMMRGFSSADDHFDFELKDEV